MQVETKNASLDTMAVTIQALHVSGKQMTLAVFRQLPIALAFNDLGELRDLNFWGLVRYEIKNESSLWVVASAVGILYRCDANPRRESITYMESCEANARLKLKQYMAWEPTEIAWQAWHNMPFDKRNAIACPPRPGCGNGFKVGQEDLYVDEMLRATAAWAEARTLAQSTAKLAALPQLFIAV